MDTKRLNYILSVWDRAGERPYEALREESLYDDFINYLSEQHEVLEWTIYRGTRRHNELEVGDTLNYQYPTSWSTGFDIARKFIDKIPNSFILSLTSETQLSMIYNYCNSYREDEVILAPYTLKIVGKHKEGDLTTRSSYARSTANPSDLTTLEVGL
ncbi:Hypothetical protein HVR_LOCUS744 [uncultured virus]|nr:Hypothetical protein HVR_LOCUS744 [uncultured virus]